VSKVLHIVPTLNDFDGGPSRSVTHLVSNLVSFSGYLPLLFSYYKVGHLVREVGTLSNLSAIEYSFGISKFIPLGIVKKLFKLGGAKNAQLVHSHGVFHPVNFITELYALITGSYLIIQPRGMLEPWSLTQGSFKKKLSFYLYLKRHLNKAHCIVATSKMEAANIRNLGITAPIAIIPNGIDVPIYTFKSIKEDTGQKVFMFLSRIHPKKGLENLIKAWALAFPSGTKNKLRIYGPQSKYLPRVEKLIAQQNLTESVSYEGYVDGSEKECAFLNADFFVLPSFSENFGLVVAEALSYGIPVIASVYTPWEQLMSHKCGWWVDNSVLALKEHLLKALSLNHNEYHFMSQKAVKLANEYSWQKIAADTAQLYDWILHEADEPNFLLTH